MKGLFVVSCLILAAAAKPQGYSYPHPPATSSLSLGLNPPQYQAPPFSVAPSSSHSFSHGLAPVSSHGSLGLGSHSAGGSLSLGTSYSVGQGSSYSGRVVNSGHSFGGSGLHGGHSFGGNSFTGGNSFANGNSFSNGHSFSSGGSSFGNTVTGNGFAAAPLAAPVVSAAPLSSSFVSAPAVSSSGSTLVQKHIYVHVPPPDEEDLNVQPHSLAAPAPAQKHYKIIFIKAPSAPSVSQQLIQAQLAQQQQSEEKTLVYVLVKKPESLEELAHAIPRAPLSQPSKPEVYFIKYKAQTAGGGFSQPIPVSVPLAQPIGLSAPVSQSIQGLSAPEFVPSVGGTSGEGSGFGASDASLSGVSGGISGQTTIITSSSSSSSSSSSDADLFSGQAAAAAAAAAATSSSSAEHISAGGLSNSEAASIAAVIQPRTPAPEYGPPKH